MGSGSFKWIVLFFDVFNLLDIGLVCLDYVGIGEFKFDINRVSMRKYCGFKKFFLVILDCGEFYVWFFVSGKMRYFGF